MKKERDLLNSQIDKMNIDFATIEIEESKLKRTSLLKFLNKEWLKNKLPILAKRFFDTQRRKRRHSRATSRLSDAVYWKISQLKSGSYSLTIPKYGIYFITFAFGARFAKTYEQMFRAKLKEKF